MRMPITKPAPTMESSKRATTSWLKSCAAANIKQGMTENTSKVE